MEVKALATLVIYGPLGIMVILQAVVIWKLYADLRAGRGENEGLLKAAREEHRKEMDELQARYIVKAENYMEKYHELSKAQTAVLESMAKLWAPKRMDSYDRESRSR